MQTTLRPETFGRFVELLRTYAGWSQEELGERAGLSNTAISNYETKGAVPQGKHLMALATAFSEGTDIPVATILEDFYTLIKGRYPTFATPPDFSPPSPDGGSGGSSKRPRKSPQGRIIKSVEETIDAPGEVRAA